MLVDSNGLRLDLCDPALARILGNKPGEDGGNILKEAVLRGCPHVRLEHWLYCLANTPGSLLRTRLIESIGQKSDQFVDVIASGIDQDKAADGPLLERLTCETITPDVAAMCERAEFLRVRHRAALINEACLTLAILETAGQSLRCMLEAWAGTDRLNDFRHFLIGRLTSHHCYDLPLTSAPLSPGQLHRESIAALQAKDYDRAEALLHQAIEHSPAKGRKNLQSLLAIVLVAHAVEAVNAVSESKSATAAEKENVARRALGWSQEAARLDPQNPRARANLTSLKGILERLERVQEMEEEYGGAPAAELQQLAVSALSEGDQARAIDYLRQAISSSIRPAKLERELSDVLTAVAVAQVNAAQVAPSDSVLRQAAELLSEALELNPQNARARENQRILDNLRAQAEQRAALLREYGGAHAFELQQKAVQAFNNGHHQSAINYLREAIRASSQPERLRKELSRVLAAAAVTMANASLQRLPRRLSHDPRDFAGIGSELLRARDILEEAIVLDPSNTHASQNLSVLRPWLAGAWDGLHVGLDTGSSSTRVVLGDSPSAPSWSSSSGRQESVTRRAGTPEVPGGTVDRVHFSVASPATVVPGTSLVVDVWAYIERQRQEVLGRIAESLGSGDIRIETKGPVELSRGTILTVRLSVEGLVVDDPEDTILWQGEIGSASFPVTVPREASFGPHRGKVAIYSNGLNVARLYFSISVGKSAAEPALVPVQERRYRTAFASYASQDRDEVLLVVMGLQKGMPDLDVFLDVARLRAGQKWQEEIRRELAARDIFYLFWSRAASQSEWVEKEWRCALETRGIDYIDPVPMVPPDIVPPPRELAEQLHFNEWTLAYRSYSRLKEMFGH